MRCLDCHGDGTVSTTVVCGVCGGDAEYLTEGGLVIACDNCTRGEVETTKDCPTCDGIGFTL